MNTGTYVSGIGHTGLVVWALIGGVFFSADDPLPLESTEVSLLTSEQFAALMAPSESPEVSTAEPTVDAPEVDDAPVVTSNEDAVPESSEPVAAIPPEAETVPEQPQLDPIPQAEVSDEAPDVPQPPTQDDAAAIVSTTDDPPKPAPAPLVAPEPAALPEPDTQIADTVAPEVVPDEAAADPQEEQPATAPEAATTEIVTEAETPSAPTQSIRPKTRPKRPPVVVEAEQVEQPQTDAIADAVAAAVSESAPETSAAPSGPPLSSGERDALRVAVSKCWNTGSLSSEALRTTVVVAVSMTRDGKPEGGSIRLVSFEGGSASSADKAYGVARRAIIRCGVSGYNLPSDKYSQWQDIEMTFNPEKMRFK